MTTETKYQDELKKWFAKHPGIKNINVFWNHETESNLTKEDKAREFLKVQWAIENGLSHQVRIIDSSFLSRKFDVVWGKYYTHINWKYIPDKILDIRDEFLFHVRKFFLEKKNPYA